MLAENFSARLHERFRRIGRQVARLEIDEEILLLDPQSVFGVSCHCLTGNHAARANASAGIDPGRGDA